MEYRRVKNRRKRGSAIAEFGPALYVLLFFVFWPMLNLLMLGLTYSDCLYLHNILLRQAAVENVLVKNSSGQLATDLTCSTSASGSLNILIENWTNSGLGKFVNLLAMPTQTAYVDLSEGSQYTKFIHVTLNVESQPFLNIPFFLPVPGLNAPIQFVLSGRAVIEYIPN